MKFKFKIGDKVRIISDYNGDLRKYSHLTINKCINLFGFGTPWYEVAEDDGDAIIKEDDLELIEEAESVKLKYTKPTKEELLDMPKGTKIFTDAKKDNEFVYDGNTFCSENTLLYPSYLKYDLTINPTRKDKYGTRITKIKKPTYETVYEEYGYEEYNMEDLREENEKLTKQVAELQEKLKQANIDVDISKQESDIADIFFNEEE